VDAGAQPEAPLNAQVERNALKDARSPYLAANAQSPVFWNPYHPDVWKLARKTGRPVLISVGATWCIPCQAMDESAFKDPEAVRIINSGYVAVKVDAAERPDLDARLQEVAQVISKRSGWPLNVVFSPDGLPLFSALNVPARAEGALAGLAEVLGKLLEDFRRGREDLLAAAQQSARQLTAAAPWLPPEGGADALWKAPLKDLEQRFDAEHGGLKGAPKTLHPRMYALALHAGREWGDAESLDRATRTLTAVCRASINDVVGGGFFRMAEDEAWNRPSLEKLAVQNALMLEALLDAYAITQSGMLRGCAQGVLQFVAQYLTWPLEVKKPQLPPGKAPPLGQSLDEIKHIIFGDSVGGTPDPGSYGLFYSWTLPEVRELLPADLARVAEVGYGLKEQPGTFPNLPMRNLPRLALAGDELDVALGRNKGSTAMEELEEARKKLNLARADRVPPPVDTTSYAESAGHLIRTFLAASPTLGIAAPRLAAIEVLESWVRFGYRKGGGFAHGLDPRGFPFGVATLGDQAAMIRALVEGHLHSGDQRYLEMALDTAELVHRAYQHASGAYMDSVPSPQEPPVLLARGRSPFDGDAPAANAEMALALLDLSDVTRRQDLRARAGMVMAALAREALGGGVRSASWGLAAWRLLNLPIQVVLVERNPGRGTVAMTDAVLGARRLGAAVYHVNVRQPGAPEGSPTGAPRAYACANSDCMPPTEDAQTLRNQALVLRLPTARPTP
ncbi:MAG: DUF255 domain-containing protein, partial [Myxococcota bacterium]